MVWAPKTFGHQAIVVCHSCELGNRIFRILLSGARKSTGGALVYFAAAEDNSRGHYPRCVCDLCNFLYGSKAQFKFSMGKLLSAGCRVFYLSIIGLRLVVSPSIVENLVDASKDMGQ